MKYLILIAALFFASCAPTQKAQNEQMIAKINEGIKSWIGKSKNELLQHMGAAHRYAPDGKGGDITIYEYTSSKGMFIYNTWVEKTEVASLMFFADKNGIIYHGMWKIE